MDLIIFYSGLKNSEELQMSRMNSSFHLKAIFDPASNFLLAKFWNRYLRKDDEGIMNKSMKLQQNDKQLYSFYVANKYIRLVFAYSGFESCLSTEGPTFRMN